MKVLVTGGAGFIGSTVCNLLKDSGHFPIVLDDFSTGRREFVREMEVFNGDVTESADVTKVWAAHPDIDAVIHCAAKIVVPDSFTAPIDYYKCNVAGTLNLIEAMADHGCDRLIFSGSAAIYAESVDFSVTEESALAPKSPYAHSKAMVETILTGAADAGICRSVSLRYFNPIGADPLLRTGNQLSSPTHALGRIISCASRGETFQVTGTNFPTRDGSGLRDYVHVWDLARAHLAALRRFDAITNQHGRRSINLGTGSGTTVLELIAAYEQVSGERLDFVSAPPRPGDAAGVYTTAAAARELLDWRAEFDLLRGVADSIAWFQKRAHVLADLG